MLKAHGVIHVLLWLGGSSVLVQICVTLAWKVLGGSVMLGEGLRS